MYGLANGRKKYLIRSLAHLIWGEPSRKQGSDYTKINMLDEGMHLYKLTNVCGYDARSICVSSDTVALQFDS